MWSTTSHGPRPRSALRAFRPRWPIVSLAVTSAVLLTGCGGHDPGPAIDRADAQQLIALTRQVPAAKGGCAQQHAIAKVQAEATRLVDARRVPPALEESLMSGVNALVADQPTCLPDVPVATTAPKPSHAAPRPHVHIGHGHGPGHHHGPGHGPDNGPGPGHGPHGHHGPGGKG